MKLLLNSTNSKKYIESSSFIAANFLLFLFFFYNLTENSLFFFVGVFSFFLFLCVFNIDDLTLICSIIIPNLMMIKKIDSSSALVGYFMLIIELKYLLKLYVKDKNITLNFSVLLFLISCVFSFIVSFELSFISSIVRNFFFFTFCFLFFKEKVKDVKYIERLIKYYIYGTSLVVVLGVIYDLINGYDLFAGYFSGIRNDRNYFSSVLSVGISTSILYYYYYKRLNSFGFYCNVIVMTSGGILSASRTFFLSLFFSIILIVLLPSLKTKLKTLSVIFFLFYFALMLYGDRIISTIENVVSRFSDETAEGGSGRWVLWEFYLSEVFKSIKTVVLGCGAATTAINNGIIKNVEHNTVVQALYSFGFSGLMSYVYMIFKFFQSTGILLKTCKLYMFMPLCSLIFCYMGISGFMSDNFNFALIICILLIAYSITREGNKGHESCSN